MSDTRWLTPEEQRTWRAYLASSRLLLDQLDRELQRQAGMPHAYYELLVRLSEATDRRLRMSDLARLTTGIRRLRPFLITLDHRPLRLTDRADLRGLLTAPARQLDLF